ncbi:hypothetical protein POM88_028995 [Heracleum sosnowskyi]|uniref:ACT domain-containing protein n=1 Tax=Heracleum sosnowskyi TaxID=360622 RepID=A0AAD8HSV8_9APIA|nr:hypothetical protein POM88_028995 [Heracleum sosnowskyi]
MLKANQFILMSLGHLQQVPDQSTTLDAEINTFSGGHHLVPMPNHLRLIELHSENILCNLPQAELRLLCSLLANKGLSDNAYVLVAEVLKKLVAIVPVYCHLFISELAGIDRPGLLSQVCAVSTDLHCNLVNAEI